MRASDRSQAQTQCANTMISLCLFGTHWRYPTLGVCARPVRIYIYFRDGFSLIISVFHDIYGHNICFEWMIFTDFLWKQKSNNLPIAGDAYMPVSMNIAARDESRH